MECLYIDFKKIYCRTSIFKTEWFVDIFSLFYGVFRLFTKVLSEWLQKIGYGVLRFRPVVKV